MTRAYYHETNPHAAQQLRALIDAGRIALGEVDMRSVEEVTAADLSGFTQCHFSAGTGGWPLALRLAGWPDDRPVWTGSCPHRLVGERRPETIFGEQAEAAAEVIAAFMEAEGAGETVSFGSVCSGIEAASVAWDSLGLRSSWFAEIEAFPSAVLAHRWPETPNLGDMTTLAERVASGEIDAPDVLVGGTPCQAFSVAGLRKSLEDSRGQLSLAYCRLADAIDSVRRSRGLPECIVVWENVPGVLNTKDNAFGCFLAGLAGEVDALIPPGGKWANAGAVFGPARTVCWRVLDAQYFGVAQRRRRVFVIASARKGFDPLAVLFESEGVRRDTPPRREAGKGITHPVAPCLDRRGAGFSRTGDNRGQDPVVAVFGGNNTSGELAIAPALLAKGGSGRMDFGSEALCVTGDPPRVVCAEIAPCLLANGKAAGSATNQDAEDGALVCIANSSGRGWWMEADEVAATLRSQDSITKADTLIAAPSSAAVLPFDTTQITSKANRSHPKTGDPCHPLAKGMHPPAIAFQSNESHSSGFNMDISPTLRIAGKGSGGNPPAIAFQQNQLGEIRTGEIAGTLNTNSNASGRNTPLAQVLSLVRRLTPTECERLQGFPDGYTLTPYRGKPAADGPRYKALGNSMAVPVMRWIGERLLREMGVQLEDEITRALKAEGAQADRIALCKTLAVFAIQERASHPNLNAGPGGKGYQEGVSYTLEGRHHVQSVCVTGDITHALKAEGADASEDGTGRGTPIIAFSCKDHGADAGEISPTLRSMGHDGSHQNGGGQVAVIAFHHNAQVDQMRFDPHTSASLTCSQQAAVALDTYNQTVTGDIAQTLCSRGDSPGGNAPLVPAVAFAQNTRDEVREMNIVGALAAQPGMKQTSYIRQNMQVRRLTPTECERLQGFPDGYTLAPYRGKPAADGPRYKALGNSMAVPVMRWIGRRLIQEMRKSCI